MRATSRTLPPLLETAIRGRSLRVAAWLAALLVIAVLSAAGVQSHLNRRAEAFVHEFLASAGAGVDHNDFIAPGSEAQVQDLRKWMTPEHRFVRCKPFFLPFSRYYECVAQFSNGSFAYLDVEGRGEQKRVTLLRVAPPNAPR